MKPKEDDLYALWALSVEDHAYHLLKTYKTEKQLRAGWEKHKHISSLQARVNVGGKWWVATDRLFPREQREYSSAEQRDGLIIKEADHFTIVRFLGVGQYERHKRKKRKEALELAENLSKENQANYMVYAVSPLGRSAFVTSFIYHSRGK